MEYADSRPPRAFSISTPGADRLQIAGRGALKMSLKPNAKTRLVKALA
jgi:hypothetical protein